MRVLVGDERFCGVCPGARMVAGGAGVGREAGHCAADESSGCRKDGVYR